MAKLTDLYRNCPCNTRGDEEVISIRSFGRSERHSTVVIQPLILFILNGSARVTIEGVESDCLLRRNDFMFAPSGAHLICNFVDDCVMIELRLSEEMPVQCPVFRIGQYKFEHIADYRESSTIYPLRANRRLTNLASEMQASIADGFVCRHFLEGETTRFLFLLNAYYSEEERVRFFSRVITPDIRFSEFVRMNHSRYRTIYDMADELCLTPQAFSNRFKKVFGTTPHRWMQREKARHIYRDICRSEMPLKAIASKYGFPLTSNFFRFCKQTFGDSPGNIRRSLRSSIQI